MSTQISTLTFFRYCSFADRVWAFFMMQFAHSYLSAAQGQQFYKLMGSGKGKGFNPWPDWSVYSLLQVWESEKDADRFINNSPLFAKYKAHTSEMWTIYLKGIMSHGTWSGSNPFIPSSTIEKTNSYIAVITRAKIKSKKLLEFWKYVPTSSKALNGNTGLVYTKGIGEVPLLQMATFSLWKDMSSLKKFAYESKEHQVAIEKTKTVKWYSEELFSRFQPYKSIGNWKGTKPLEFP